MSARYLGAVISSLFVLGSAVAGEGSGGTEKSSPRGANGLEQINAPEGFAVLMPPGAQPQRNSMKLPAGEVKMLSYSVADGSGAIFSISTVDYPEKLVAAHPAEKFLHDSRDGLATQLRGKVSDEKALKFDRLYPATRFTIDSDNGRVRALTVLVGPRLYTMLVLFNASIGAPAADTFLDSLKLKNPPKPIPAKPAKRK